MDGEAITVNDLGPDVQTCQVCNRMLPVREMIPGILVRPALSDLIRRTHPAWSEDGYICVEDLHRYRMQHMREVLETEKGELTELEERVLESLHTHAPLSQHVLGDFEDKLTLGERLADRIATFGGSWRFISMFAAVLVAWMLINTLLLIQRPFDPYPFILLNLVLSCLAAVQAPVIMMSQNRQEAKDRHRAEHDYQVNLKAELEVRQLHDKLDHLLLHQWERLLAIQQVQIDIMEELVRQPDVKRSAGQGRS